MENHDRESKRIKRTNCIIFGIFVGLVLAILAVGIAYSCQRSFSTKKWESNPEERTKIVDDLLCDYDLIGMRESEIMELLGSDDHDYGYFNEKDRFVYYLGPERGLISIDSEWLILNFENGVVSECFITTD